MASSRTFAGPSSQASASAPVNGGSANDSGDLPPPYQARGVSSESLHGHSSTDIPPPDYGESNSGSHSRTTREAASVANTQSLNLVPETALYLLGKGGHSIRKRVKDDRTDVLDPSIWEFELVCLVCFEYAPQCCCLLGYPVISVQPDTLPNAKMPNKTFPYRAGLVQELGGQNPAHMASVVAHSLWPVICQGMIPISDEKRLVVLRSKTLDQAVDPKDILRLMRKPPSRSSAQNCPCCGNLICEKVITRHGLRRNKEALRGATISTYTIRGRSISAVRLINGKTCFDLKELGLIDMDTSAEEDFLFYCSVLPTFGLTSTSTRIKDPSLLNWDQMLVSLLQETLSCERGKPTRYEPVTATRFSYRDTVHAVLRGENFGIGPGFIVLDWPHRPRAPSKPIVESGYIMGHVMGINQPRRAEKAGFFSTLISAQPVLDDLPGSTRDGWKNLTFDTRESHTPTLKKASGFTSQRSPIGLSKRPIPGVVCYQRCKATEKNKRIQAHFAGFAPPAEGDEETTVYLIGDNAIRWLVVSQFATSRSQPLYFSNKSHCLGCTIAEAPRGSIIAASLPSVALSERAGC
ncbi:unnamed protein product [Clonostachys solani]|uniref:Uncharacterized protein n=1 Tax=Clonostachys solani TaxID=160281 RepID=A0A9N9WBD4_9HYPO|nr:unnamed protein product [Clonostachys solani]